LPTTGTITRFYVTASHPVAAGTGRRLIVRINGSNGGSLLPALYCDIVAGSNTCSNTLGSLPVTTGDKIDVEMGITPGLGNPGKDDFRWTALFN
jgi:hypothetical protein